MHFLLPCNKYHFTDPEEPNSIPLIAIHAANDSSEGQQLQESCDVGEAIENSTGLADANETPEQEVEAPLNGKSQGSGGDSDPTQNMHSLIFAFSGAP